MAETAISDWTPKRTYGSYARLVAGAADNGRAAYVGVIDTPGKPEYVIGTRGPLDQCDEPVAFDRDGLIRLQEAITAILDGGEGI